MEYTVHPAAELFPMMGDKALQELTDDIKKNGQLEPIKIWEKQILDGRNRLAACEVAEVKPIYQEITTDNPLAYVISENLYRRHLTTKQRSHIAADLANMTDGNPHRVTGSNEPVKISNEQAAEMMNVSTASVKRAKKVKKENPAAHEAAKQGKKVKKPKPAYSAYKLCEEYGHNMTSGYSRDQVKADIKAELGSDWTKPERERDLRALLEKWKVQDNIESAKESAEAARSELSKTAQQKLDTAIRKYRALVDSEVEEVVTERLQEILPDYNREYERYKKFSNAYGGVLRVDQYKLIVGCLHPDREASHERKAKAFDLMRNLKEELCGLDEKQKTTNGLPKTVAELMAKRKSH